MSKTLRLVADFTYDDTIMHGDDAEGKNWFFKEILLGNDLLLNDIGQIGDTLGGITILGITERANTKPKRKLATQSKQVER